MAYRAADIDNKNASWFQNDVTRKSLRFIEIDAISLRGLSKIRLDFQYPITAISGKNGIGKSTILGCVACAFHNKSAGYNPLGRRFPYYTFADFFMQTANEPIPWGVVIKYGILYNQWRPTKELPEGIGIGTQYRIKHIDRWNKYDSRVSRNTVFLGIERVVPHVEKSVYRTYRNLFKNQPNEGFEIQIHETVGRILGKQYENLSYHSHRKYKLPVVKCKNNTYSGFNMGAGENALFQIFSIIYGCDESLLLVIDEIELGLHEEAQSRLIAELKKICLERKIQIVFSTHSAQILEALPLEARIHLEPEGSGIRVIANVSAAYAAGLLSGKKSCEVDIFVEDELAKEITELSVSNDLRRRIRIIPIGSFEAVTRQMAARYKETLKGGKIACAFYDGDQSKSMSRLLRKFEGYLEVCNNEARQWFSEHAFFLPGDSNPEKWILSLSRDADLNKIADEFGVTEKELKSFLDLALSAPAHEEFRALSDKLNLSEQAIRTPFVIHALSVGSHDVLKIETSIRALLNGE